MRALVQRVRSASVDVEGQRVAAISQGFLVLVGVHVDDTADEADALATKVVGLRVFEDEDGKMNLSVTDVSGSILAVSQFTLYADASKGRRPSFQLCAPAALSRPLYERFLSALKATGVLVQEGIFGAHMIVRLENDGPVTVLLETARGG